jgi:hypothetical protein
MSAPPSPAALRAHARACERGEAGYMDPETGLFVMTSVYLRRRRSCCGTGCRHCPWSAEDQRRAGRPPGRPAWPWPPLEGAR